MSLHVKSVSTTHVSNRLTFFTSNLYESPWFFMCATLLPDDGSSDPPFELETTFRSATGCMVSSLNHLKDLKNQNGAFFVFPDISIRVDGHYRFRMTLFEITE